MISPKCERCGNSWNVVPSGEIFNKYNKSLDKIESHGFWYCFPCFYKLTLRMIEYET